MLIDITLKVTPKMVKDANNQEKKSLVGHIGTHFDVMNKEFPLEYSERHGIVFDVSHIKDRDIKSGDINCNVIKKDMFIAFYSGYINRVEYGSVEYFREHPQLSNELIDLLVEKEVSIIGIDFAGVRKGKEHPIKDQYCADHDVFVVENLCHLNKLIDLNQTKLIINTYPMNYADVTGLPCRVIAKI